MKNLPLKFTSCVKQQVGKRLESRSTWLRQFPNSLLGCIKFVLYVWQLQKPLRHDQQLLFAVAKYIFFPNGVHVLKPGCLNLAKVTHMTF